MIPNYFKFMLRTLVRERFSVGISLTGLVIGHTTAILILLFVNFEFSYDPYHPEDRQLFRVTQTNTFNGEEVGCAATPAPLAEFLKSQYPQTAATARLLPVSKIPVSTGEKTFSEEHLMLGDRTVLDFFGLKLEAGPGLVDDHSIIITRSTAVKYFGNDNPIGKTIAIDRKIELTVTGIIADIPPNTHFHFDFLAPISAAEKLLPKGFLDKINTVVHTYLQLSPASALDMQTNLNQASKKFFDWPTRLTLQPVREIHLRSHLFGEFEANGSIEYVRILQAIALVVLLVACVNHVNLSAALYSKRLRKIGMIKVIGARRAHVIGMFFTEALILSFLAACLALLAGYYLLPLFNELVGRPLHFSFVESPILLWLALIMIVMSLAVTAYPALLISGRKPSDLLRSESPSGDPATMRKAIVTFQFAVTIVMIIVTIVMIRQMDYIHRKDVGFNKQRLLVVPIGGSSSPEQTELFKRLILGNANIIEACVASDIPGTMKWITSLWHEGIGKDERLPEVAFLNTDPGFMETFGAKLVQGRNFSMDNPAEPEYLINEAAVKSFGWTEPLGKELGALEPNSKGLQIGKVVGVIRDFNFKPLQNKIEPLFLRSFKTTGPDPEGNYIFVRIAGHDLSSELSAIGHAWKEIFQEQPYEYFFYDSYFDQQYKFDARFGRIALTASGLAIVITCLGLFGLAAFSAQQRRKEIAVRKVFGASVGNILLLLASSYLKIILIAELLAVPAAFYFSSAWLSKFAYHIDSGVWVYLVAGLLVAALSILTIGHQSMLAAKVNPVKWMRYE